MNCRLTFEKAHGGVCQDIHFTADNDDGLIQQIRQHRDEYHQEISDDQVREMVSAGAYDEADSPAGTQ